MKRLLASVLALVMLLGMLPLNALATEETADATEEAEEEVVLSSSEEEHTHAYASEVTDPTCTEQGYTTYTCVCGDSYVDDYVDADGHTYANGICVCGETQPGPIIIKQPESVYVCIGEKFSFTVEAEGDGLTYQWYYKERNGEEFLTSDVKSKTYSMPMVDFRIGREYYCVITDANGNSVQTDTVEAVVSVTITKQPTDSEAAMGEMFCATVEAKGEGLTYRWYFRNAGSDTWNKSGVKDNTYDDVMTADRAGREVYCVVTDANGNSVTSDTVKLICIPSEKLEITTQPVNSEAVLGETFCVTVEAKGEGLTYQWYFRDAGSDTWSKSGVKDNTYDDVMTKARAGRRVYCVITDVGGNTVTSDVATLVQIPVKVKIISQPTNAEAALGETFCATVEAKGDGLKYQWYFRNAGSDTWTRSDVRDNTYDDVMTKARRNREIFCVVTDAYGNSATTKVVKLIAVPKVELKILTNVTNVYAAMGEDFCVTVEAQGDDLTYRWYFRNAGSDKWSKSGVKDNTYDDVMTKARANREVYCVITDALGNTVTTEVATLVLADN